MYRNNNKQKFSLNTELSNQKVQQKFYESKYYQFKTIDQFQKKHQKNIRNLEQRVLNKDELKVKLENIKQQKQFQEDKQIMNNLKNQKFDFEKVQEKGQVMFLKKMGFNKQNIPDLNINLTAKQMKEQKQSLQQIQKKMMNQINQSIRQLEKKNNEKFDQFKQQVDLYNNFYCAFLTDEKDRFEQFLNKHKLNVKTLKYFDQEQMRTNESNKMNDSNSDQSELNQYLQTQFIDTNDMIAENKKYLEMIDEFNFDYHGKSNKYYFQLVNIKRTPIQLALQINEEYPSSLTIKIKNIGDYEDKFGLGKFIDNKVILEHLKIVNYKYSIDDLTYFIVRLYELKTNKQEMKGLVDNLKMKLKNEKMKYPLIGKLAYNLQRLKIEDEELWRLLEQYILDDNWYMSFSESYKAVQGFTSMLLFTDDKQRIGQIYKRIERVIRISIWEENMIKYRDILVSLQKVDRYNERLFNRIENHIMNNLAMEYELKEMLEILIAMSHFNHGKKELYESLQLVIVKGHLFNRSMESLNYDGHLVSIIMQSFAKASLRSDMQLDHDFKNKMFHHINHSRMDYQLADINRLLQSIPFYEYEDQNQLESQLVGKIINIQPSYAEMIEFINTIGNEQYKQLQQNVRDHIEQCVLDGVTNESHHSILKMFKAIKPLLDDQSSLTKQIQQHIDNTMRQLSPQLITEYSKIVNVQPDILKLQQYQQQRDKLKQIQ